MCAITAACSVCWKAFMRTVLRPLRHNAYDSTTPAAVLGVRDGRGAASHVGIVAGLVRDSQFLIIPYVGLGSF